MAMTMFNARRRVYAVIFCALISVAALTTYATAQSEAAEGTAKKLRIIWTNDMHGYLNPLYHREPWEKDYLGIAKKEGKIGGWANIATLIKELRGEMPDKTLLLDAGDTWHGTGVALFTKGAAIIKLMNALKYDAMTPGNTDFLFPKEVFAERAEQANFPILAANMYDMEWGDPAAKQYVIKEVGGLKVAIIGMAYQWTAKTGNRAYTKGWSFGLREDEMKVLLADIKQNEKPDLVIVLSHMGYKVDQKYASRIKGIDVMIGAHTHDNVYEPPVINGTIVVQAGSHGKFLGKLDLIVKNGKIEKFDHKIIRVVAKDIKPDREIQKIIDDEYAPYSEKLKKVIGKTKTMLYRRATWQSTMDNFITDAYREMYKTDVALSPAWRFGLTILPGSITVEDVYGMVPTQETIITFVLKGSNLKSILEAALDNVLAEDPYAQLGGDLIRHSGMSMKIDEKNPFGKRIVQLTIGGKPYDREKKYTIVSANTQIYTAETAEKVTVTNKIAVEELIRYIEKKKVIAPKLDGRVKIVKN